MGGGTRKLIAHYVDETGTMRALALSAPRDKPVSKVARMLDKKGGCLRGARLVDWHGEDVDGSTLVGDVATDAVGVRGGPARNRPFLRLDASTLDKAALWRMVELGVHVLRAPVVVERATQGFDLARWTRTLRSRLLKRPAKDVQFVRRRRARGASEKDPTLATFREVLEDRAPASTHAASGVTMCELALQREPDLLAQILETLPLDECRPAWAKDGANLFESDAFPPLLKPPPMCLVLGGDHASCDLHADHYGWVGWSLLCDGAKKWRFSERTAARDAEYRATRQPVFDEVSGLEGKGAAGSFQSDVDLYRDPSTLAESTSDYDVDTLPGDLLLFPGDLWHQTLHRGTTLSVCSQFCSEGAGLKSVINHVRDWYALGPEPRDRDTEPPPARVMASLVDCLGPQKAAHVAALRTEVPAWRQAIANTLGAAGAASPAAPAPVALPDGGDSSEDDLDGFGGLDD